VLNSFNSDTVHAGQGYLTCDILPHVSCATSFISLSMAAFELPPPPTPADVTLTVPGMFNLVMNARVLFADPNQNFFIGFERSGPASITLQRGLGHSGWSFESGFAEFEPTPEPATLLLFATSGAGLGLVRWYRRREQGQQHAAYRVSQAGDGEEALRIVEAYTESIHLLLTDVVMPHFNGVELAGRLTRQRHDTEGALHVSLRGGWRPARTAEWSRA
jgi:CheY-like chemotaxis protein